MISKKEYERRFNLFKAALLSGEFKQGVGNLKAGVGNGVFHCCMGVACEVAKRNGVPVEEKTENHISIFNGRIGVMPEAVQEYFGFCYSNGGTVNFCDGSSLSYLNDIVRLNFAEIVQRLESNMEKYFTWV